MNTPERPHPCGMQPDAQARPADAQARPAPAPAPDHATRPVTTDRPAIRSADLFGGGHEVLIEHQSQVYRLRRTQLGKLILTK